MLRTIHNTVPNRGLIITIHYIQIHVDVSKACRDALISGTDSETISFSLFSGRTLYGGIKRTKKKTNENNSKFVTKLMDKSILMESVEVIRLKNDSVSNLYEENIHQHDFQSIQK